MPRVVPSQALAFLTQTFPNAEFHHISASIGQEHAALLGAVVAMVDSLPSEMFVGLPPGDYVKLVGARGAMAAALAAWAGGSGKPGLGAMTALGNISPLHVLHDVLKKCPDEAPAEHVKEYAFLGDVAPVIRQDMSTAHSALGNGEFKAAQVMAGSVIEALLMWALKRTTPAQRGNALVDWQSEAKALGKSAPKTLPTTWDDWKLYQLINIGRRISPDPIISGETAEAANSAREFRNLIHPERADKTPPTMGTAQIALGAMVRVGEEIEALATAGKL